MADGRKTALDLIRAKEKKPFPGLVTLLFEAPIYGPYIIPRDGQGLNLRGPWDGFCSYCGGTSVFTPASNLAMEKQKWMNLHPAPQVSSLGLKCAKGDHHLHHFTFLFVDDLVLKIGQWPTYADIAQGHDKEYRSAMSSTDAREMFAAVGLFAHKIGIGSFVYLRRIFERIIWDTFRDLKQTQTTCTDEEFRKKSMDEKIKELRDHLPPLVAKTPGLYGVLSKGLHELDEDECKDMFPLLRQVILSIVVERKAQKDKAKEDAALRQQVEELHKKLNE